MRIQNLALKAFGPFTDLDLGLEGPSGVVNVIFGENEAGKSSALRALEGFCFGIPRDTNDNHVHSNDQMRIGATLKLTDETVGSFFRRKGNKNTLLDGHGASVPDQALEPFLCGVAKSGFEALFCLSYARLNEGSESILLEGGELGKLLFEARSDLNLRALQNTLESRTSTLYKGTPRASSVIDEALRIYDSKRQVVRKGDLADYSGINKKLDALKTEASLHRTELHNFRTSRQKLERFSDALPGVRRLRRDQQRLAELGPIPDLEPGFPNAYLEAKRRRASSHESATRAQEALANINAKLSQLTTNDLILPWQGEIERLYKQVQQISSHLADIPKQELVANEAFAEAKAALAKVRPGEEPEEDALNIEFFINRIAALGRQGATLNQELKGAQAEKDGIEARLKETARRLAQTAEIHIPPGLDGAVIFARGLGDAETSIAILQKSVNALENTTTIQGARLGAGNRMAPEFAKCDAPMRAYVQQAEESWQRVETEQRRILERLRDLEKDRNEAQSERITLIASEALPREDDLLASREQRSARWIAIKGKIVGKPATEVSPKEIDKFEWDVARADELADRLRIEAGRVALLTSIEARIEGCNAEMARQKALYEPLALEQDSLKAQWLERWQAIGVKPDMPRQMVEWVDRFEQLGNDTARLLALQQEIDERTAQLANARTRLADPLGRSGEDLPLIHLLSEAERLLESAHKTTGELATLTAQVEVDTSGVELAKSRIEAIQGQFDQWQTGWQTETQCLGLARTPSAEEADEAIKSISRALERLRASRIAEKRVHAMTRDLEEFTEAASKVVEAVGSKETNLPPVAAIENLYSTLRQAIQANTLKGELVSQQLDQTETLTSSELERQGAELNLIDLCSLAGCKDPADLEPIVDRYGEARKLRDAIQDSIQDLEARTSGRTLDEFCEEVASKDEDTIVIELSELQTEIEKIEAKVDEIQREIGAQETELTALDNTKAQLQSQIDAEDALAKVRSAVRPYLVYSLAETLIKAQIEEFRIANQGPILQKASEIFSVLTDGSFTSLTSELDDKDKPVLVASRNSPQSGAEQRLKVAALSSASRIALYLSLRLACLYHHCDQKESLPFVADDILLDFDDSRARRVMEELGRLAQRTQVILFTHHRHLVDIAQEVVGKRCLVSSLTIRSK